MKIIHCIHWDVCLISYSFRQTEMFYIFIFCSKHKLNFFCFYNFFLLKSKQSEFVGRRDHMTWTDVCEPASWLCLCPWCCSEGDGHTQAVEEHRASSEEGHADSLSPRSFQVRPNKPEPDSMWSLFLLFLIIIVVVVLFPLLSLQWDQMQQMDENETGVLRGNHTHTHCLTVGLTVTSHGCRADVKL